MKNVLLSSVAARFVLDYADDNRRYNFALIDSLQLPITSSSCVTLVAYTLLSIQDAGQLRAISTSLHGGEVFGGRLQKVNGVERGPCRERGKERKNCDQTMAEEG